MKYIPALLPAILLVTATALMAQDAPQEDAPELAPAMDQPAETNASPAPVEIKRLPRLGVVVEGLKPETGTVEISLFNSEESFMVKPIMQESGTPDKDGRVSVLFLNVFEGEYGLVVVHDENGNGLYDAGFLGFGAEPVAYSNNARPWLGRPSFDAVKFDVQETMEITIQVD